MLDSIAYTVRKHPFICWPVIALAVLTYLVWAANEVATFLKLIGVL